MNYYRSPPLPELVLDGPADFGNIVAKSRVVSRELKLSNFGAKKGDFKIKYHGNKPITITPSSGTVHPLTSQTIMVR